LIRGVRTMVAAILFRAASIASILIGVTAGGIFSTDYADLSTSISS